MIKNDVAVNEQRIQDALASLGPQGKLLWTERMAAAFLHCSVSRLQKARFYGRGGPAYLKVGRMVRYVPRDVVEFSLENRVEPLARSKRQLP